MTITEKILAVHAERDSVKPGELVSVKVDMVLGNDITAPVAIDQFRKTGAKEVFDPDRIALVPDHFAPNRDIASAEQCARQRDFAREQNIRHYFEVGRMGIEHCLLPEKGLVGPGEVIIGADSHTCTYGALGAFATGVGSTDMAAAMALGETWLRVPETMKFVYKGTLGKWVMGKDLILNTIGEIGVDGALYRAMEFTGEAIRSLSMDSRFTMANMAVEAGAKNGIIEPDETTMDYVRQRSDSDYGLFKSDPDAEYTAVFEFDVTGMEPQVAFPHSPENTRPISGVGTIRIDQAVIGSCTNGRMEDIRIAAEVMRGRRVHPHVRCLIFPGTQAIYLQAVREGLVEVFIEAGAMVSGPTCGPCLGGHMGVLSRGERCISTTNRNFVGRMGHPESEVFLANPAIAAASAILGRIASPEEL
jgi:3-isopropylmalate/(R)-2-methylmalate dehydratase large subunit